MWVGLLRGVSSTRETKRREVGIGEEVHDYPKIYPKNCAASLCQIYEYSVAFSVTSQRSTDSLKRWRLYQRPTYTQARAAYARRQPARPRLTPTTFIEKKTL